MMNTKVRRFAASSFFSIFIFLVGATLSLPSFSHSPMFEDYFKFDDSNNGGSVSSEMRSKLSRRSVSENTAARCIRRRASGYPCLKIDLQSFVPKAEMGAVGRGVEVNDIWGWTDPQTGSEIAIVGLADGTSFVDITDPVNPVYLGKLPSHAGGKDAWRDMKVYADHVYIVGDGSGNRNHGLQVFDLGVLRSITSPPRVLTETGHLGTFGNAHNIAINEDTGYAYIVGSNKCSGGLHMVSVADPKNPKFEGCFSSDGYTHDVQCVTYRGPDGRYSGKEICFGYNEDTITIIDVTNKRNPTQISRTPYDGSQYTHQGWLLDENQSIAIMNDELDEAQNRSRTTSYIFDMSNLRTPKLLGRYRGPTNAIDHNLYTKNGYVIEANYRAGLRILSSDDAASGKLKQVAYFDTVPNSNTAQFSGAWSSYVDFQSGNIIVSDIGGGLFVLRPKWELLDRDDDGGRDVEISITNAAVTEGDNVAKVTVSLSRKATEAVTVVAKTLERSAKAGSDFRQATRRLRFRVGQQKKTIRIRILDDRSRERTETLFIDLKNASNATIKDKRSVIRIRDND